MPLATPTPTGDQKVDVPLMIHTPTLTMATDTVMGMDTGIHMVIMGILTIMDILMDLVEA